MADRERNPAPPAIGGSSLLVAFAVLCLTVFAMLSLTTVQADQRLGAASAQAVEGYYAADSKAQEVLACLRAGVETPADVAVSTQLIDDPDGPRQVCSWSVPISETQELQVTAELDGDSYTVLHWQVGPAGEWAIDEGMDLWDGELIWDGELP